MKEKREKSISQAVVNRMPRYYRYLSELISSEIYKISSGDLSRYMNVTASQIRQDLNCFGGFGQQGYGYNVRQLHAEIGRIMGVDRNYKAVIVGAGNLGRAMANSNLFKKRGVMLAALFDINVNVIGTEVAGYKVYDIANACEFCREEKISIAALTLPKAATEPIAKMLADTGGIRGFWNFSNMELKIEKAGIKVQNMHMGDSLMTLCYSLSADLTD